jgi:hypothetical protein
MNNLLNKYAQFTAIDKELRPEPTHKEKETKQVLLPFPDLEAPDYILLNDKYPREWKDRIQVPVEFPAKKKQEPKEPLDIKLPEISPEHIRYRGLNQKEQDRLSREVDSEYRYHNQYNYNNKPFEPSDRYKKYMELDKALPDDQKKKIIDKYNELRFVASNFQKVYNEANRDASEIVEMDYSGTYFDLMKNFSKFVINAVHKELGALFGIVQVKEKYRGSRIEYSKVAKVIANFINKGINLFNIHPFNFEEKLNEMDYIISSMNEILTEYNRRAKLLKKLPELEMEVKGFLLKKDVREFLKWLDEYFPQDILYKTMSNQFFIADTIRIKLLISRN